MQEWLEQTIEQWTGSQEWVNSWRWESAPAPTLCLFVSHGPSNDEEQELLLFWSSLERATSSSIQMLWLAVGEDHLFVPCEPHGKRRRHFPPLQRVQEQREMGLPLRATRVEVLPSLKQLQRWHSESSDWSVHTPYQLRQLTSVLWNVLEELIGWVSLLEERSPGTWEDDLVFLEESCWQPDSVFPEALHTFAKRLMILQLRAEMRQWQQSSLSAWDLKTRDALHGQLSQSLTNLHVAAGQRYRTVREQRLYRKKIAWLSTGLVGVLLIGFFGFLYWNRPPSLLPLKSFKRAGDAGGIQGFYYKNSKLKSPWKRRTDKRVYFLWKRRAPLKGFRRDYFSVRWMGFFRVDKEGVHNLCIRMDDGGRLYVNNKRVINKWRAGKIRSACRQLYLKRGWYPLKLEMFERKKYAAFVFSWKPPGAWKRVTVPSSNLCCKK